RGRRGTGGHLRRAAARHRARHRRRGAPARPVRGPAARARARAAADRRPARAAARRADARAGLHGQGGPRSSAAHRRRAGPHGAALDARRGVRRTGQRPDAHHGRRGGHRRRADERGRALLPRLRPAGGQDPRSPPPHHRRVGPGRPRGPGTGGHVSAGAVELRPRAVAAIGLTSIAGLLAFLWPLVITPDSALAHSGDAPLVFAVILVGVLAIVLAEVSDGGMDTKAVAMLGVLSAVGAILRPVGAGTAGLEGIFFLLILGG